VLTVHQGVRFGLIVQAAVLAGLVGAGGVGMVGAVAGIGFAAVVVTLLVRALARAGARVMGPADVVTLGRAALVGGVAALVAESLVGPVPRAVLTALAAVALVLDGVDGRVARNTGTASAVGARFDMEVDSVLVLLLSVYVAALLGPWVLAIGSAHYALVVARRGLPWLRAPLPPRYWCKVVAVVQGLVLVAAGTGVLPRPVAVLALVVVAALLVESFGREVWELWRSHRAGSVGEPARPAVRSVHA
jgi:phosphatidylglycerophosphate synthase